MNNNMYAADTNDVLDAGIDIDYLIKRIECDIPIRIIKGSREHKALLLASAVLDNQLVSLFNLSRTMRGRQAKPESELRPQSVWARTLRQKRQRIKDDKLIRYLIAKGSDAVRKLTNKLTDEEKKKYKLK